MAFKHLRAVVCDWAGTVVDYGSLAPMGAFVSAFAEFGVEVSVADARLPMGLAKRPHVAALLAMPHIAAQWEELHGHTPGEADIDAVYRVFVPKNVVSAAEHSELIPGAAEFTRALREEGLRLGTTTGYTREIMAAVIPRAAEQGFSGEAMACADDTPQGRPSPFPTWKVLADLGVYPAWRAVKIDDTEVGIGEGLNAGAWSVGVTLTGNLMGLTQAEIEALPAGELAARHAAATARMQRAGAHFTIDGIAELMPVLAEIEGRLERGLRP